MSFGSSLEGFGADASFDSGNCSPQYGPIVVSTALNSRFVYAGFMLQSCLLPVLSNQARSKRLRGFAALAKLAKASHARAIPGNRRLPQRPLTRIKTPLRTFSTVTTLRQASHSALQAATCSTCRRLGALFLLRQGQLCSLLAISVCSSWVKVPKVRLALATAQLSSLSTNTVTA